MPTAIIGEIKKALKVSVVDTLPDQGRPNRLYFVLNGDDNDNRYNEYIWIKDDQNPNGVWELVGYKYVDLTPYYTKEEVDNLLKNKLDNSTFEEFEEQYNQTVQELQNKDKELEESIQEIKDTYLPLTGGTMTGDIVFSPGPDANGYEYVDLGLPSGNLWAKYNIGATSEKESGLYFQWGDTQGYTAEQVGDGEGLKAFNQEDYKFSINGLIYNFSKYNKTDNKTVLDPEDDAAHVNMGGNWRTPTEDEFIELCMNTDIYLVPTEGEKIKGTAQESSSSSRLTISWEREPSNQNIKGVKFYKKGDKQTYMFVPAAGCADGGSVNLVGKNSRLWSSSLSSSRTSMAWDFFFNAFSSYVGDDYRSFGVSVRGILPSTITKSVGIKVQGKTSSDLVNAAGSTTSIDDIINPVTDDFTQLIVRLHAQLTVSVNRSVIYKGESDTVTLSTSATFDGNPLTYTYTVDEAEPQTTYTLQDSHTFNVQFNINNEDPKVQTSLSKSVTVNARYPRYYGRLASDAITGEQILTLTKQPRGTTATISDLSLDSTSSDYIWLCIPEGMTIKSVSSSGFAVPMKQAITVAVQDKGNYLCYRSTNQINPGTITINVS